MRSILIGCILLGIFGVPLAVCAAEDVTMAGEIGMVAVSEPVEDSGDERPDLAPAFGRVHSTLLMSAEEAFGYLLMENAEEKKAFYDDIIASEEAFAAFEDAAARAGENESILAAGYGEVMASYGAMTTAADAMFASFEEDGSPVMEDVRVYEEAIDAVFNATDAAWADHHAGSGGPSTAQSAERALYGRLLAAVEESYAYPVIGDVVEKEDALADFADVDARIALYGERFPEASFTEIRTMKEGIQTAAETMFATYEQEGSVSPDEAAALEELVEEMNVVVRNLHDAGVTDEEPVDEVLVNGTPAETER